MTGFRERSHMGCIGCIERVIHDVQIQVNSDVPLRVNSAIDARASAENRYDIPFEMHGIGGAHDDAGNARLVGDVA